MIAVVGTLAWEFQVTLPLMASNVFHGGAAAYGVMGSVMGAGAVVGGLISAARAKPRARALCLAAIGWASPSWPRRPPRACPSRSGLRPEDDGDYHSVTRHR
jgi:Transmembrane secretion effector